MAPLGHSLQDEMKALARINSAYFLAGYLGFLATWILDTIYSLLHKAGVKAASDAVAAVLRALSPHYNLARWDAAQCQRSCSIVDDPLPLTRRWRCPCLLLSLGVPPPGCVPEVLKRLLASHAEIAASTAQRPVLRLYLTSCYHRLCRKRSHHDCMAFHTKHNVSPVMDLMCSKLHAAFLLTIMYNMPAPPYIFAAPAVQGDIRSVADVWPREREARQQPLAVVGCWAVSLVASRAICRCSFTLLL